MKVGDKVRVIGASHGWGQYVKMGDVGIIALIEKSYINVDFPDKRGWVANIQDLQPLDNDHYEVY